MADIPKHQKLISLAEIRHPISPNGPKKRHGVLRDVGGFSKTKAPEITHADIVKGTAQFLEGLDDMHGVHGFGSLVKAELIKKAVGRISKGASNSDLVVKLGHELLGCGAQEPNNPLKQLSTEALVDKVFNAALKTPKKDQVRDPFPFNTEAEKLVNFFKSATKTQLEIFLMLLGGVKSRTKKAKAIISLRQLSEDFNMQNVFNLLNGKTSQRVEERIRGIISSKAVDSFLPRS